MKNFKRIAAAALAVAVSAAATGSIAYAKSGSKSESSDSSADKSDKPAQSAARTPADSEAYKDETVYVLCNTDSSVKNVVVSDWLKNAPALSSISDI